MAGQIGTQVAFTGQLKSNEIYQALYNWIISQTIFDIKVKNTDLVDEFRVDGTLFGDTYLYYSADVGKDYAWGNDAEAPNLLQVNRNTKEAIQAVTLDIFRQCNITIDTYLSKRAWANKASFSRFNGILLGSLESIKKVYDYGLIATFIGTQKSSLSSCNRVIDFTNFTTPADELEAEAQRRVQAQMIMTELEDIKDDVNDNTREYNELGYLRCHDLSDYITVWNSRIVNKITKLDLPSLYHTDGLKPNVTHKLLPKYIGTVIATAGVSTGVERCFDQGEYTDGTTTVFLRYGDIIPTGYNYGANQAYSNDSKVILKLIHKSSIPFLSAFVASTMFRNERALNENHYLTWGHSTLQRLKEYPFITLTFDGTMTLSESFSTSEENMADIKKKLKSEIEELELKAQKLKTNKNTK